MKAAALLLSAALVVLGGCAHTVAPPTADLEGARREERRRVLQDYWYEQTLAPTRTSGTSDPLAADYPPGVYAGVRYGARRADDPGIGEPAR